jgi:EAL domain-containing protein (putative c-di-GMP-specific phosphodiesterase class I)
MVVAEAVTLNLEEEVDSARVIRELISNRTSLRAAVVVEGLETSRLQSARTSIWVSLN